MTRQIAVLKISITSLSIRETAHAECCQPLLAEAVGNKVHAAQKCTNQRSRFHNPSRVVYIEKGAVFQPIHVNGLVQKQGSQWVSTQYRTAGPRCWPQRSTFQNLSGTVSSMTLTIVREAQGSWN